MFEKKLEVYLEEINSNLEKFIDFDLPGFNEKVSEAMRYCLFGGGKRLRAILTLAVCEMFGDGFKKAIPFACAAEFIHVGSLIHDDLPSMDDDDIRRNKPSCHVKFGEANAILAGDSFFLYAFKILVEAKNYGLEDFEIVKACEVLSKLSSVEGMVFGQAMEIFAVETNNLTNETLNLIFNLKTSALFKAACVMGAIAAKASDFEVETLNEFADAFGLAFQIRDDILDGDKVEDDEPNLVAICGLEEAKKQFEFFKEKALSKISCFDCNNFMVYLTNKFLDV